MGGKFGITLFIGLKSKTYYIEAAPLAVGVMGNITLSPDPTLLQQKVSKGIVKAAKKNKLRKEHYLNCLQEKKRECVDMTVIRASNHRVYTAEVNKQCFSSFDDKRFILPCGIHTEPYGSSIISTTCSIKNCRETLLPRV